MDFTVYGIALVPVLVGLLELLKRSGIPKRLIPLLALALGIFMGFYYLAPANANQAILSGIALGLSAIGLFSGAKNTLQRQ